MISTFIRIGFVLIGIVLMAVSFWMNSHKKITVNFAVVWELLGLVLICIGAFPGFSEWTKWVGSGTSLGLFCVGAIFLFEEVRTSVILSQLMLKNRELAMQVALLNQENEFIVKELEKVTKTLEEIYEEDTVCR